MQRIRKARLNKFLGLQPAALGIGLAVLVIIPGSPARRIFAFCGSLFSFYIASLWLLPSRIVFTDAQFTYVFGGIGKSLNWSEISSLEVKDVPYRGNMAEITRMVIVMGRKPGAMIPKTMYIKAQDFGLPHEALAEYLARRVKAATGKTVPVTYTIIHQPATSKQPDRIG